MNHKYLVLEKLNEESTKRSVIEGELDNLGVAYKLWLQNPAARIIVKVIGVEVKEK